MLFSFNFVPTGRRVVHRAAFALTLGALAVPATAAGQASTNVDVQHIESSGEVVNTCTGEVSVVSGQGTAITREVVDGVGGSHFASIGTGVFLSEDSVVISHGADPGPSNFNTNGAGNVTDVIHTMTISRGSDDNSLVHINHTDVFGTPGDGTNTSNVREECLG
jgi:hypothetical protein